MTSHSISADLRCVFNGRDQLGETPIWCPRSRRIWWIDIEQPQLHAYDERTGQHEVFDFRDRASFLGSLALHRQGGFLIALDTTLYRFDPADGTLDKIVEIEPASAGTRLNDGRCDHQGRFWVGTMDAAIEKPLGSLYCVEPDGTARRYFGDIIVSNSIATSPDDSTLYVSDTRRYKLWAFDLDARTAEISGQRVFVDYETLAPGRPDGACVDAEGYVWNAVYAGSRVVRYSPQGEVDRVIHLPTTNPTCVCFGGDDLGTLYISTATKAIAPEIFANEPWSGALLSIRPGVRGLPEPMFG